MKTKIIGFIAIFCLLSTAVNARIKELHTLKKDKSITYLHIPAILTSSINAKDLHLTETEMKGISNLKGIWIVASDNNQGASKMRKWLQSYTDKHSCETLTQLSEGQQNVDIYLQKNKKRDYLIVYANDEEDTAIIILKAKIDIDKIGQ